MKNKIEINQITVDFEDKRSGHLKINFDISKKPKTISVNMYRTLDNDQGEFTTKELDFETECIWDINIRQYTLVLDLIDPKLIKNAILRAQIVCTEPNLEGKSDIEMCKIIFPKIENIRSYNENGEMVFSWETDKIYNNNLFFQTEISNSTYHQIHVAYFENKETSFPLNQPLKNDLLVKSRVNLVYGNPRNKFQHLANGWSRYRSVISKQMV